MRMAVQYDDVREFELKPSATLKTYLQLTESDIKTYFLEGATLLECNCPACLGAERNKSFVKFGLQYWECANCKTLYISPRPEESVIDQYYKISEARKFWEEKLSRTTEDKRREKVFRPRIEWIIETVEEYLPSAQRFADINTIHHPYIQELLESKYFKEITILNPKINLDRINYRGRKVQIVEEPIDALSADNLADGVSLFEVIDRLSDVDSFFRALRRILSVGGLCFLTTISISGFDLQVLWEKSNSIFPPDRINVLSLEGLILLFERHGFDCLELSTPGLLDIEVVANAYKEDPSIDLPRFVRYLLENRDVNTHHSFQEFLQMNRLSSFTRMVLRKKG